MILKTSLVVIAECMKKSQIDAYHEILPDFTNRVSEYRLTVGRRYKVYGFSTWDGGMNSLLVEDYERVSLDPLSLLWVEPQLVAADWFVSLHRADELYVGDVYDVLHVRVGFFEFAQDFLFAGLLSVLEDEQMSWFREKKAVLDAAAAERDELAGYGYVEDGPEFSTMEVSAKDLLVDGLSGVVGLSDLLEIVGLLIGLNEARFVCAGESDELLTVDSSVVDVSCARMPDGWWVATQKISHAPDVKGRSCSEVLAFGREDIVKDAQWVERLWGQEPQAAM